MPYDIDNEGKKAFLATFLKAEQGSKEYESLLDQAITAPELASLLISDPASAAHMEDPLKFGELVYIHIFDAAPFVYPDFILREIIGDPIDHITKIHKKNKTLSYSGPLSLKSLTPDHSFNSLHRIETTLRDDISPEENVKPKFIKTTANPITKELFRTLFKPLVSNEKFWTWTAENIQLVYAAALRHPALFECILLEPEINQHFNSKQLLVLFATDNDTRLHSPGFSNNAIIKNLRMIARTYYELIIFEKDKNPDTYTFKEKCLLTKVESEELKQLVYDSEKLLNFCIDDHELSCILFRTGIKMPGRIAASAAIKIYKLLNDQPELFSHLSEESKHAIVSCLAKEHLDISALVIQDKVCSEETEETLLDTNKSFNRLLELIHKDGYLLRYFQGLEQDALKDIITARTLLIEFAEKVAGNAIKSLDAFYRLVLSDIVLKHKDYAMLKSWLEHALEHYKSPLAEKLQKLLKAIDFKDYQHFPQLIEQIATFILDSIAGVYRSDLEQADLEQEFENLQKMVNQAASIIKQKNAVNTLIAQQAELAQKLLSSDDKLRKNKGHALKTLTDNMQNELNKHYMKPEQLLNNLQVHNVELMRAMKDTIASSLSPENSDLKIHCGYLKQIGYVFLNALACITVLPALINLCISHSLFFQPKTATELSVEACQAKLNKVLMPAARPLRCG